MERKRLRCPIAWFPPSSRGRKILVCHQPGLAEAMALTLPDARVDVITNLGEYQSTLPWQQLPSGSNLMTCEFSHWLRTGDCAMFPAGILPPQSDSNVGIAHEFTLGTAQKIPYPTSAIGLCIFSGAFAYADYYWSMGPVLVTLCHYL